MYLVEFRAPYIHKASRNRIQTEHVFQNYSVAFLGGSEKQGWIPRETAADILYDGFRSPLVHELGTDEGGKSNKKPLLHDKYVIGKRGMIPANLSLAEIINRDRWGAGMGCNAPTRDTDRKKVKVSLVGLYVHTRKAYRVAVL